MLLKLIRRIIAFLFGDDPQETKTPDIPQAGDPKWLKLAKAEIGTKEVKGDEDNPVIMRYYADAGFPEIKHDETPWCAGFVGAMLERSGYASAKTLWARSYMKWGKKLSQPKLGCIVVFSRGDPRAGTGHVGFYMGQDLDGNILLLGGNQSNQVSITTYSKSRLLGYRWPVTAGNSRTFRASMFGILGGGTTFITLIAQSLADMLSIASEMKTIGAYLPGVGIAGSVVAILAYMAVIWARQDDLQEKGR